jgi:mannose/cellobiose epimerase-like protein (N-acyl-D-glucosamine 2-epimerase family)
MSHAHCKRIWEGTLGIAIMPRKKRNGDYFWSFSFVRAFRRTRDSNWEYVQHFGQQHATALGTLMSKAFHFMEQTEPAQFLERAMADAASSRPKEEETADPTLESIKLPVRAAA